MGQNFGILIAWIVISFITLPLFAWIVRRRDIAAMRAAQAPPPPPVEHEGKGKETA